MNEEVKKKIEEYVSKFTVREQKLVRFDVEYGYELAQEEIERLKGIIETQFMSSIRESGCGQNIANESWSKFKETNKL